VLFGGECSACLAAHRRSECLFRRNATFGAKQSVFCEQKGV